MAYRDSENQIESTAEKFLLVAYLLAVLLSSLIGDSIILVASTFYKALKLRDCIIALMQNIAVCDLLLSLFLVLPTIVSLIAGKSAIGDIHGFQFFIYLVYFSSLKSSNVLLCLLTTCKLSLLKFPLRTKSWNKEGIHVVCLIVWTVTITNTIVMVTCFDYKFHFSFVPYTIIMDLNPGLPEQYFNATDIIFNVVPTLVVTLTTIIILHHLHTSRRMSRRSGGSLRWQGMATVTATASVFVLAILPNSALHLFFFAGVKVFSSADGRSNVMLSRCTYFVTFLNIMSNFYIYSLTVPSFRTFLREKANLMGRKLASVFSATENGGYDENEHQAQLSTNPVSVQTTDYL